MTDDTPFPAVPRDLLEKLEDLYPNDLPTTLLDAAEYGRLIGRQDVLRKLRHHFDRQIGDNTLETVKV